MQATANEAIVISKLTPFRRDARLGNWGEIWGENCLTGEGLSCVGYGTE